MNQEKVSCKIVNQTVEQKNPWFADPYELIIYELDVASENAGEFLAIIFNLIELPELINQKTLINIQGRTNTEYSLKFRSTANDQEILELNGTYQNKDDEEQEHSFSYRVVSKFNNFNQNKLNNTIQISCTLKNIGDFKELLEEPFQLHSARLGLDFYRMDSLISVLAKSPGISEYIYIEFLKNSMFVKLKKKNNQNNKTLNSVIELFEQFQ